MKIDNLKGTVNKFENERHKWLTWTMQSVLWVDLLWPLLTPKLPCSSSWPVCSASNIVNWGSTALKQPKTPKISWTDWFSFRGITESVTTGWLRDHMDAKETIFRKNNSNVLTNKRIKCLHNKSFRFTTVTAYANNTTGSSSSHLCWFRWKVHKECF